MVGLFDNVNFGETPKGTKAKSNQVHITTTLDIVSKVSQMRGINTEVSRTFNLAMEQAIIDVYNQFEKALADNKAKVVNKDKQ